ncbi:hypothetical protein [Mycolicibacterium peregrinum]|uniref:hypothetical protein n=1 Tax=Mycolicibacterium peregrinum TaxID=43304 RepID=UPI0010425410|nr:hypothetical protein [Mycolicibacterium peregrinum]
MPAEPTVLLEWATLLSATVRAAVRAGHPALFHATATDRPERLTRIRLSFKESSNIRHHLPTRDTWDDNKFPESPHFSEGAVGSS